MNSTITLWSRWLAPGVLAGFVAGTLLVDGLSARQPTAGAAVQVQAQTPDASQAAPVATSAQTTQSAPLEPTRFTTRKSGRFGGRDVRYLATAGETFLRDANGAPRASIFTFAYVEEDADSASRPVTFLWNGGPGSSSVWLHMGGFGPTRVVMPSDGRSPGPAPYRMAPNAETILDVTDLVFVDPVGTGFSRALGEHKDEEFWNLNEDTTSIAAFIVEWLTEHKRWQSPKFLAGESFGTTRAAAVANQLHDDGVDVNGLVLASQALDFAGSTPEPGNFASYLTYLPTMAATAWYHGRVPKQASSLEAFLNEARGFGVDEYAPALLKGSALGQDERARVLKRLAYFTGLDEAYLERSDLRVLVARFLKELLRSTGVALGRMDARYSVDEVDDVAERADGDPTEAAIAGPFDAALRHYIGVDLGVSMPFMYRTRNQNVIRKWSYRTVPDGEFYEPSYVNVAPSLGRVMRRNPALRVFGASGYYDFATPFFDAELTFARYGIVGERLTMVNYESGHMLYVHEPTRQRLLADVRAFVSGDTKTSATQETSQVNR